MSSNNENILLKIYEEVKETKEQVKEIPQIKQEILEMKKQVQKIAQIKKQLEEIPKMKDEITQIKKKLEEIPEIKQELRNISGSVARIEVEHGEKLVALFDAFKINTEKIEEQNKRITKCENILEKHEHQLYILNSKVQNS